MVLFQPTGYFFSTKLLLLGIANPFDLTFLRFQFRSFWLGNYWQVLNVHGNKIFLEEG